LLPQTDRDWLDGSRVVVAAAIRLRDGAIPVVIVLAHDGGADALDRSDRWFIASLLTAASAAWDSAGAVEGAGVCGDECVRCGRVRLPEQSPCCAGAETRLAALPTRLSDRFVVLRRLNMGGMGIVYLGRDVLLQRDVALKTWIGIREGTLVRLRSEAQMMAGLNHDALATIFGLEHWRRTPVLVMEYCPRGTLADRLSCAPLALPDLLRAGIQLSDALAYMHCRGVFHRDIKPSNIGFTERGAAKLLDFGLAGVDEQEGGTPAYLPPEILHGAAGDEAVDLWGLATSLQEACDGDTRLDAFFARALARRPADRFQSSLEMHAALCRLLVETERGIES
jgi:tRNA A-37 threonylcarbamoyl transferase component Bud32